MQPNHPDPIEALAEDALPDTDVFCGGQAFLADGRLLAAGGTSGWAETYEGIHNPHYDGERACWIYLPRAKRWAAPPTCRCSRAATPSTVVAATRLWSPWRNGEVFAVGGHPAGDDPYPTNVAEADRRHNNNTPERYSPGAASGHELG
jgi:hypothetical protein